MMFIVVDALTVLPFLQDKRQRTEYSHHGLHTVRQTRVLKMTDTNVRAPTPPSGLLVGQRHIPKSQGSGPTTE